MATIQPDPEVEVRHEGTVESVYAGDAGVDRLKPNAVGLWGVIFVAVTGAAPISAMLFNVPFATGFGTGIYTPAAFLFATIILTIFSIGYFAATNFNDWFGWEIPWVAFALFAAVLISILCYFDVELSVRVLGFALIGEIIILVIFDLLVFGGGGGDDG